MLTPEHALERRLSGLIARAEPLLDSLAGDAREQAARVIALARSAMADAVQTPASSSAARRELAQLTEFCGRRGAWAIPFATLARATSAALSGDGSAFVATCGECEEKLAALGF